MEGTKVLYPVLAAVLVLGLCATGSAQKQNEKESHKAPVKTSLMEAPDDMYVEGSGPVGQVIFNTNDDGELVTEVRLDKGAENATFDVLLNAHPEEKDSLDRVKIGTVSTDRHGAVNATYTSDVPDDKDDSTIYAQVVLSGQEVSYATKKVEVPLQK